MKKTVIFILALAMLLSLAACGSKQEPAPVEEPAPTEAPVTETQTQTPVVSGDKIDDVSGLTAAANLDPTAVDMGATGAEDKWYKDAVEGDSYITFSAADNSAVKLACTKVEAGSIAKTWLCTTTNENHLVDQEAEDGKSDIDIVFVDALKAYDAASGTWYVRGNAAELAKLFTGKQFAEKDNADNTLILNADGTGKEVFEGKEEEVKWEVSSAAALKYVDDEHEHTLTVVTDAGGNLVSLDEQNFRSFLPAA